MFNKQNFSLKTVIQEHWWQKATFKNVLDFVVRETGFSFPHSHLPFLWPWASSLRTVSSHVLWGGKRNLIFRSP